MLRRELWALNPDFMGHDLSQKAVLLAKRLPHRRAACRPGHHRIIGLVIARLRMGLQEVEVEIEGEEKPALIAEWVTMQMTS